MSFEFRDPLPKKRKKGEVDLEKRKSLKTIMGVVGVAAGLTATGVAVRKISEMGDAKEKTTIYPNPESEKKQPEQEPEKREEQGDPEIEPDMDYAESLSDMLDFEKDGPIQLTPEIMKRVREYWKERYKKDPRLRESLEYAYREMGYWIEYLKDEFSQRRVPEQFAYLAIPESHWNFKKMTSPAGAFGYYQIMPDTGKKMGLKIGTVIDERMDPIKGAGLCARYLKEWHDKAKGNKKDDNEEYWFLALAAYNGSFAQKYINKCDKNGEQASYKEHLRVIEERLNKIKDDLKQNNLTHVVGKRETLSSIARKYGIGIKEFRRVNALKGLHLKKGQSLVIPTINLVHEAKKKVFAAAISGFSENLNYPEKFNAVNELIEEHFVTEQKAKIDLRPYTIKQEVEVANSNHHTVKKGETLSIISRKYGVPVKKIAKNNKLVNLNNIKPGDILNIPGLRGKGRNSKAKSLITEAIRNNLPIEKMSFKNQHVRDRRAALPNGTELRV